MDEREPVDVTNLDDPSTHYGLGHAAAGAGGGINHYLEQKGAETEAEEKRRRADRRDLERQVRDHNREHPDEPWAMPKEDVAVNAEVGEAIERRIRQLQAEGLTYYEATARARQEYDERASRPGPKPCTGDDSCRCENCNRVTEATLQREGLKVEGGSKSGGKVKHSRRKRREDEPYVLASYSTPGRPPIEETPRTKHRGGRVSEENAELFDQYCYEEGLNTAAVIAAIGQARKSDDPSAMFLLHVIAQLAPRSSPRDAACSRAKKGGAGRSEVERARIAWEENNTRLARGGQTRRPLLTVTQKGLPDEAA